MAEARLHKLAVGRARKIERFFSQPFSVAEVFTGTKGKYVSLKDTISGFKGILAGEYASGDTVQVEAEGGALVFRKG